MYAIRSYYAKADYVGVRERHAAQQGESKRIPLAAARANKFMTDWSSYTPPVPRALGMQAMRDYDLAELAQLRITSYNVCYTKLLRR